MKAYISMKYGTEGTKIQMTLAKKTTKLLLLTLLIAMQQACARMILSV
jgi:hypothetical protein